MNEFQEGTKKVLLLLGLLILDVGCGLKTCHLNTTDEVQHAKNENGLHPCVFDHQLNHIDKYEEVKHVLLNQGMHLSFIF